MTNLYVVDGEIAECSDREPSAVEPPARTGFRTIWYMEEDEDMLKEILERLRRSIAEKEVPEQEVSPEIKEETIIPEPENTVLYTAEFVPLPETREKVFVARYYIGRYLAYCIPFTANSGLQLNIPVGFGITGLGWGYVPLEAKDTDIHLVFDKGSTAKASASSPTFTWKVERFGDSAGWTVAEAIPGRPTEKDISVWRPGSGTLAEDTEIRLFGKSFQLKDSSYFDTCRSQPLFDPGKEECLAEITRIKTMVEFHKSRNNKLVFIGEPGKGKTTTICNWTGLTRKDCTKVGSINEASLLTAASGHTTAFEVRIRQVPTGNSRILVEGYPYGEFVRILMNFSMLCFGNEPWFDPENTKPVSAEIRRLVSNMAGLEEGFVGPLWDDPVIMRLKEKYPDSEELVVALIERIHPAARNTEEIKRPDDADFEDWLSTTFDMINEGSMPGVGIPKSVTLEISLKDRTLNMGGFNEIIDTIGLDSEEIPENLLEYMHASDTVCIFANDLGCVPSMPVVNAMRTAFTRNHTGDIVRTGILVKSPFDQLIEVNECNGDADTAIALKNNEMMLSFRTEKIPFRLDNAAFLDSCQAYSTTTRTVVKKDEDGNPVRDEFDRIVRIPKTVVEYDEELGAEFRRSMNRFIERITSI